MKDSTHESDSRKQKEAKQTNKETKTLGNEV